MSGKIDRTGKFSVESLGDDLLMKRLAQSATKEESKVAFGILFDRHSGLVLGYCSRILADRGLAEDVSQDVWMKVIQNAHKYEARNQLRPWLLTLSRNACINLLRSRRSFVQLGANSESDDKSDIETESRQMASTAQDEGTAIQSMIARDESLSFRKHLDALPVAQRTALSLLLIEELSYEEIARAMDLGLPAVKTHIHRGRKHLEQLLQPRVAT